MAPLPPDNSRRRVADFDGQVGPIESIERGQVRIANSWVAGNVQSIRNLKCHCPLSRAVLSPPFRGRGILAMRRWPVSSAKTAALRRK